METNYFGAIRCIQAVVPEMRQRRSGCVINVASISGRLAGTPMGPYAASKFALEALSECLAQEVMPFNVRVAVVEPGIIDTQMATRISALMHPTPPTVVADKVLEIAAGESWQFRHLVGPDAAPFIAWRQAMSDEEWVALGRARR